MKPLDRPRLVGGAQSKLRQPGEDVEDQPRGEGVSNLDKVTDRRVKSPHSFHDRFGGREP